MERVVYKNVYNYLVRTKLIYEYQSGFLPRHSTIHQLLELYNSILNSLEKKEFSCFLFCDFSKALGVKPLIHQSELGAYTKVVPFQEKSSFHFVVL